MIPNKVFQALACGAPVITADTPAARELLADRESALLIPAGRRGGARGCAAHGGGRPRPPRPNRTGRPPHRTRSARARTSSDGAGARSSRGSCEAPAPLAESARLGRDGGVRRRVHVAVHPPPPRVQHRTVRPRELRPGDLDDRARRRRSPADQPARRADLPPRRPLRADPARVRAAVVDLAAAGDARDRPGNRPRARRSPGVLARAQAPALGASSRSASSSYT